MMIISKHLIIKGRVQGVYYRDSARRKALELGVTGWVRNMPNGDVEALLVGERDDVNRMLVWIWEGPTMAVVREVIEEDSDEQGFDGFKIRN